MSHKNAQISAEAIFAAIESDAELLKAVQRKIGQIHASKRNQTPEQMSANGKAAAQKRWGNVTLEAVTAARRVMFDGETVKDDTGVRS